MIFKPTGTKLWDTFILPYNDKYYLYYLQLREHAWDGYGLAVSDDLIHWEDHGTIFTAEPEGSYMGTGMVFRAKDKWILNFSYSVDGTQKICFAESDDLLHWKKLPEHIVSSPDPRWYEHSADAASTNARWDSIWAVPQADGRFIGFLTASAKDYPPGANGAAGIVYSDDGLHWTAGPPVTEPCGMVWAEVGCYVHFGGRHYLLVGSTSGLGPRFDPIYNPTGKAGGMYVMQSDSIEGPYRLVEGDPMLLGCRNAPPNWAYLPTYFARVLEVDGQQLLCHHWMSRTDFLDAWLGTVKVLEERSPGNLVLRYWHGNDKLKGETVFDLDTSDAPATPTPQSVPVADWISSAWCLKGSSQASAVAWYEVAEDFGSGVVIEADVRIEGKGAAGLFFGVNEHSAENPYQGVACLANARGLCEFGRLTPGISGPTFMAENNTAYELPQDKLMKWRILLRGEFVEWYIDDILIQCYGFSSPASHNIGVFVERCQIDISKLTIHRFA